MFSHECFQLLQCLQLDGGALEGGSVGYCEPPLAESGVPADAQVPDAQVPDADVPDVEAADASGD
jgi:hypothetical protein